MKEIILPECSVCMEPLEKNLGAYPCGHIFHVDWISEVWEESVNWPLCREEAEQFPLELVDLQYSFNKAQEVQNYKIQQLQSEKNTIESLLEKYKTKVTEKEEVIKSWSPEFSQNYGYMNKIIKLQEDLNDCEEHNQELKEYIEDFRYLNNKLVMEISSMQSQIEAKTQEYLKLDKILIESCEKNAELEEELNTLKKESQSRKPQESSKIEDESSKEQHSERSYSMIKSWNLRYKREIETLKLKNANILEHVREIETENFGLKKQLAKLEISYGRKRQILVESKEERKSTKRMKLTEKVKIKNRGQNNLEVSAFDNDSEESVIWTKPGSRIRDFYDPNPLKNQSIPDRVMAQMKRWRKAYLLYKHE